mgnify:CR=1 FL=1
MKILLCVILILILLTLFAVWPGKRRDELRLPFYGRNYAHRGLFGKDQRPPENSLPAFAAAAQNGYGIELDKRRIVLDEQIKTVGEYTVKCKLGYEITADLKLRIEEL